jgi:hypothetical protein
MLVKLSALNGSVSHYSSPLKSRSSSVARALKYDHKTSLSAVWKRSGVRGITTTSAIIARQKNLFEENSQALYAKHFHLSTKVLNSQDHNHKSKESDSSKEGGNSSLLLKLLAAGAGVLAAPLLFLYWLQPNSGGIIDGTEPNALKQFQDPKAIYKNRTTSELYFSLITFKLCEYEWLLNLGIALSQVC